MKKQKLMLLLLASFALATVESYAGTAPRFLIGGVPCNLGQQSSSSNKIKNRVLNPSTMPQGASRFSQKNNAKDAIRPFGFHFRSMSGNGVTIEFGAGRFGAVETIFDPTGARLFSEIGTDAFVNDGTAFVGQDVFIRSKVLNQGGAPFLDYDLDCLANHTTGSMHIRLAISMSPIFFGLPLNSERLEPCVIQREQHTIRCEILSRRPEP